jgi:hypothetical protein
MTRRIVSILAMALLLVGSLALPAATQNAKPQQSLAERKAEWQERYRRLLLDASRLEQNAAGARENYARAQRRNYPRGGAREQFLIDAATAEKELEKVKQKIEAIFVEARREAIPPNWLYEVEDEGVTWTSPASQSSADVDDGRNPLYADDDEDDDDASAKDAPAPDEDDGRNPLYRNQDG